MKATTYPMTIPKAAKQLNAKAWQLRKLFDTGILPDPPRAGLVRLIQRSDLPRIRKALIEAGYLTK